MIFPFSLFFTVFGVKKRNLYILHITEYNTTSNCEMITMIIYTTLKQNRANDVDFVEYCDECFTQVGGLFGEEYVDEYDYTDWDKLWNDFTDKQIESRVLKFLKEDAKDKEEGLLFKYEKILIDRELAYDDCVAGVKAGILKASDLRDIDRKSKKYGFSVKKSDYGEDGYYHTYYVDDIIEEYFPCNDDLNGECNNCGNCE